MLLAAPLRRVPWVVQSGLGVLAAVVVMTIVVAIGIGIGASVGGGGALTAVLGTAALGLYAAALCGIGFAVGGVFGAGFAGEIVAGIVILTFLIDLVVPALKLPDWMHQLALTAHFGQPMVGNWDVGGIVLMLVLAFGGLAVGALGACSGGISRSRRTISGPSCHVHVLDALGGNPPAFALDSATAPAQLSVTHGPVLAASNVLFRLVHVLGARDAR